MQQGTRGVARPKTIARTPAVGAPAHDFMMQRSHVRRRREIHYDVLILTMKHNVPVIQPETNHIVAASPVSAPVALALLLPIAAATIIVLAFTIGEISGYTPASYPAPRNLAEATGMGIASEALRFLWQGEDPNQIVQIRPDIISSEITRVTALEAAIWSRRVRLVQMLERAGAIRGDLRPYLACLASHLRAQEIVAHLGPAGVVGCDPDDIIRGIQARSQ
jgi:hypothetical protein